MGHFAIKLSPYTLLFALALLSGQSVLPVQAEELTIYTWADYISANVVTKFEQQSGHKIVFKYYESDLERDTKLADAAVAFDIAITDAYTLSGFDKTNLFTVLQPDQLSNYRHLDPRWQDRCGPHGVPIFRGGVGIAYRSTQVTVPVDSWKQLLFPELSLSGRVSMLHDTFDVLMPPLKLLGLSANTVDRTELQQAYEILLQQQPHVLDYISAFEGLPEQPKGKGLAMAQAYSGDQRILAHLTGYPDWQFVYPKEGTITWIDCISISATSSPLALAYDFVDFLLDPSIAAELALDTRLATVNKSALQQMPPDYLNDPAVFIPASILDKTEGQRDRSVAIQAIRNKVLLSLKSRQ